jgi:branched-chain amino acid transport system permease protein
MSKEFIAQNFVNALSLGSFYALVALGMAVIFSIMRLVNFAHGELLMAGGFTLVAFAGLPLSARLALTVVVVVVFALMMERAAFRPVRDATPEALLVTSFSLSFLLQNLAMMIFGALPKTTNVSTELLQSWKLGSVYVGKLDVATIVLTIVLLITLTVFLTRTRLGVRMRAAAEDFAMARLLGVRADTVVASAFALSGVLAAFAAVILVARTGTVSPTMGLDAILAGFVATVLGGLGSLKGAVVGGLLLGFVTIFLQAYLPVDLRFFRDAFAYGAVLAVLFVRPSGLIVPRSAKARI